MDAYSWVLVVLGTLVLLTIGWAIWDDRRAVNWVFRRRRESGEATPPPVTDYTAARQRALEQLGERYLLARPINQKVRP